MRQISRVVSVVAASLLFVGCAGAAREARVVPEIPSRTVAAVSLFYSDVPIAPGRTFPSPLARGSVAGRPTIFVVDTGAQVSVIDAKLAVAADLEVVDGQAGRDPSGNAVPMRRTERPKLALDGWGPVQDRAAAVVDLPPLFARLGIGGIVSPQALAQSDRGIVLDLTRDQLRMTSGTAPEDRADGMLDLPRPIGDIALCRYEDGGFGARALVVVANVDGVATSLELDTGASRTFLVADSDVGRHLRSRGDSVKGSALGAAGAIETTRVDGVMVGAGAVNVRGEVLVTPGTRDEHCGYDGRLGIDRLRSCILFITESGARGSCR